MEIIITESPQSKIITNKNKKLYLSLPDFSVLLEDTYAERIIDNIIKNESLLSAFNSSQDFQRKFLDYVLRGLDSNQLIEKLIEERIPLFSLIINEYNIYRRNYKLLKNMSNISNITITCRKNNFPKAISLGVKYNIPVSIYASSIYLNEYKSILSQYDLNELDKYDIKIYYQNSNNPLSPRKLYEISLLLSNIASNIRKCHLSPFEETILIYDLLKRRIYKDCDKDKPLARDIDKVLKSEYIVCVGYSNLFNAIQRCLGRNSREIINTDIRHQRSITYIQDSKYDIDKVLTFDTTWDSRKEEDGPEYINKYNYFALPLEVSESSMPSPLWNIVNKSSQTIVADYLAQEVADKIRAMDTLQFIFDLVGNEYSNHYLKNIYYYDYLENDKKQKLDQIYEEVVSKYIGSDIPPQTLLRAIYNVRRVEYVSGLTSNLDINKIMEGLMSRYLIINLLKLKRVGYNEWSQVLSQLSYETKLNEILQLEKKDLANNLQAATSFEEDKKQLKLIKVLARRLTTSKN